MAVMLLWRRLLAERELYVPMDAEALGRYGFMRRLGVFGVEPGARGAAGFLRVAAEVLAAPDRLLWIKRAGRFSDVRERPVPIAPGMIRLPELAPGATFLRSRSNTPSGTSARRRCWPPSASPSRPPTSWPRRARRGRGACRRRSPPRWTALAADSIARDPALFEILLEGRQGMGGVWQMWRRVGALLRGEASIPARPAGGRVMDEAFLALVLAALPAVLGASNLLLLPRAGGRPAGGALVSILVPGAGRGGQHRGLPARALASRGVAVEVVVMDDGSRDATPAIVRRLAAEDARVRLLSRRAAAGWTGKVHACARSPSGAGHAPAVPRRRRAPFAGRGRRRWRRTRSGTASPWSAACRARSSARSARR
jgi:hypothetical protein